MKAKPVAEVSHFFKQLFQKAVQHGANTFQRLFGKNAQWFFLPMPEFKATFTAVSEEIVILWKKPRLQSLTMQSDMHFLNLCSENETDLMPTPGATLPMPSQTNLSLLLPETI